MRRVIGGGMRKTKIYLYLFLTLCAVSPALARRFIHPDADGYVILIILIVGLIVYIIKELKKKRNNQ